MSSPPVPSLQVLPAEPGATHPVRGQVVMEASGLRKAFGGQLVLDDVAFQLRQGEIVLLRGDNGSGKTTLLNILTGHLHADSGRFTVSAGDRHETCAFPARWWEGLSPFQKFTPAGLARRGVGRTWQEIRLFSTLDLLDNVVVATPEQPGERLLDVFLQPGKVAFHEQAARQAASALLQSVGLGDRTRSSGDKISLGQAKRVAILRALQAGARILFLDEPLAGLDATGIADVLGLLRQLVHQQSLTLVLVEHVHNIPRVLEFATAVWTLGSGKLEVEDVPAVRQELRDSTRDPLLDWLTRLAGPRGQVERHPLGREAMLWKAIPAGANRGALALELRDLTVHHHRRLVIGDERPDGTCGGLSLTLRRGEIGVLEAPNGWGKTTLLETVAGLVRSSHGSIRLNGQDVNRLEAWERGSLGLSLLRARNNVFPDLTVRESLRLAGVTSVPASLQQLSSKCARELSGGERQRLAAACALRPPLSVALLDEPFTALDPLGIGQVMETVESLSHDSAVLVAAPPTSAN